ncbi:MAG TPA: competence/damage-inducible protein A [Tepidisphaeraceae bacterium]|nr:competence/damage-inducible protein A [Tepidisphaeraceae bacterium]
MNAIILSIGDELVLGQTIDTNSAWLSQQLAQVGCAVSAHITVADDQAAIEQAIRGSALRCDFLIITGGIGPTADDLTRQALAAIMGVPLDLNESWLATLHDFFHARNRPMPAMNQIQAMIPRGAQMIYNTCGTAAGIRATLSTPHCDVFVMPGVPKEMKAMFTRDVLPVIAQHSGGAVILSRTLHTFGLGESTVAEMLGSLMDRTRNPSVGTTVANGIVSLRINSRFDDPARARAELEQTEAACRAALGELIFGADDESLPQIIARLLLNPSAHGTEHSTPTITTAESCTAGLLAKMLTDIPGSSAYFTHGWITYSNAAKTQLLGVSPKTLAQYGAVSEPTVCEMAVGALSRANANLALAISGIAGPDGGTPTKPVGTVCIALASTSAPTLARTFSLFGDREMIRDRAAKMALTLLRYHLLNRPLPF